MKFKRKKINIGKVSTMSIVINSIEVVLLIGLLIVDTFDLNENLMNVLRPFATVALVMLIFEGLTSVRDGFIWKKANEQNEMLTEAFEQLDELNVQLRKQRHDFINHLQVVYSLIDMQENEEAIRYIETVYGQMHRLSVGMKTAKPAVNALLQAKLANAEQRGIQLELDVSSPYDELPMNDWEFCRVLGNLLDNAMDALEGCESPKIKVELYEDIRTYGFCVSNNGPKIPPQICVRIFNTGFTTKAAGHGLGLSIVRELMEGCGGSIEVSSDDEQTAFTGSMPRADLTPEQREEIEKAEQKKGGLTP